MKPCKLILTFCLVITCNVFSQNKIYNLNLNAYDKIYTPINDSNKIRVNDKSWGMGGLFYDIPIGFDFLWHGKIQKNIKLNPEGNIYFPDHCSDISGWTVVAFIWHIVDPAFFNFGSDPTDSSISPINYQVLGDTGNRELTIEWKNAATIAYQGDTINLQVKLKESNNTIIFHFGKMKLDIDSWNSIHRLSTDCPPEFLFGLNVKNCTDPTNAEFYLVGGNGETPNIESIHQLDYYPCFHPLTSPPPPNMVYEFSLTETVGLPKEELTPTAGIIYLQNNQLMLSGFKQPIDEVTLYDIAGRMVFRQNIAQSPMPLPNLVSGLYFVQVKSNNQLVATQRVFLK